MHYLECLVFKVEKSELFTLLKRQDSAIEVDGPGREASILVTGFGMRNVDSFQRLIEMSHVERRKLELKKLWRDSHGEICNWLLTFEVTKSSLKESLS